MQGEESPERAHLFLSDEEVAETQLGESRWPPVLALSVFLAISIAGLIWVPNEGGLHVPWLVPTVAGILLLCC